jgi:hypothetical protein
MKLIFFILSAIFLLIIGVNASELIIKDCSNVYSSGKSEFDKRRFTNYYFKVDPIKKTITEVWSYSDKHFEEVVNKIPGIQKNNIINYRLLFIDNNFATGEVISTTKGYAHEITIDIKKYYVEKNIMLDFKRSTEIPMQCKK